MVAKRVAVEEGEVGGIEENFNLVIGLKGGFVCFRWYFTPV